MAGLNWRLLLWLVVGIYFALAMAVIALRTLVLPGIDQYRDWVSRELSRAIGHRVSIGRLEAQWQGLHPQVSISGLTLYDESGQVALGLPRVDATLAWRSLFALKPYFRTLLISSPNMEISRDATGHFFVAGIRVDSGEGSDPQFATWLLGQGLVQISGGHLEWRDRLRDAPALVLEDVGFRLENTLVGGHAFALSATPPPGLASTIDLRGTLNGDFSPGAGLLGGRVYAHFDYTDLAGWAPWIDYPFALQGGRGGVSLWLRLDQSRITEAICDLGLDQVRMRLSDTLPQLDLEELRGRFTARETRTGPRLLALFSKLPSGYRVVATEVAMRLGSAPAMDHLNFAVEWTIPSGKTPGGGSAEVDAIDLGSVAALASAFPLPESSGNFLRKAAPRGLIRALKAQWQGPSAGPVSYSASAEFADLGLTAWAEVPGFEHLSGSLNLDERGGEAHLSGAGAEMQFPTDVLHGGRIGWDQFEADLSWSGGAVEAAGGLSVQIKKLECSNAELALSAEGAWHGAEGPSGHLDLRVSLPRANASSLYRYIPQIDTDTAEWLRSALVGGEFTQGQVRLEGDLDRFPFDQPGSGIFTVGAQFERTTLRYRPEWPAISRIDGTLSIDRRQLDVKVDRAESKGVHLGASSIHVPDLLGDPLLQIVLSAEADADEALRYVKATPLKAAVAGSVPALQVEGRAALDMNLRLPYNHALDLRYAGTLQVNASRLAAVPDQPPLTQLSAKIQFDERSFNGRGSGQLLGGPADLTLVMQPDQGVVLTVQGTASLAAIAQAYSMPLQDRVQGQTGYRGTLVSRGQALDFVLDSDLRGVAIDLPAPFEKSADTALPLHIERGIRPAEAGASRDSLEIKLGQVLAATGAYREGAGGSRLERLGVGLGGAPVVLPGRRGVQINASLKTVDADRLMALVPAQGLPGAGTEGMTLSELALQTPELLLFGRRFAHVNLRAQSQAPHWVINMASDEATGSLTWSPEGHGRLSGQFSNLTVPQSVPGAAQQDIANSLPAMQIKAQRFTMNNRDFGRLELAAEDQDGGWRISHFSLEAPEGSITAEGLWRSQPGLGQVNVDVSIKASDAGKYLTRLGQPGTLQGGDATLNGHLRWNGVPYAVHYPSLEGEVELHAEKAQFLKVEPGVGRLLGVFSLQTLPRRITLDFRDVFSDGFAFDLVEASGQIHNGILTTHDFRMVGPAAAVSLDGTLDLAGETQNLRARIVPEVGGGLAASAGLALLNPVVGLGALIAQGFIKNPLGRLFAYDYDISGPWADPKVERVGEHPVAIGAEGGKPPGSATRAP